MGDKALPIVEMACYRSFRRFLPVWNENLHNSICILNPDSPVPGSFFPAKKNKILAFGQFSSKIPGLRLDESLPGINGLDACRSCEGNIHHTESKAFVNWRTHLLTANLGNSIKKRPFTRFDFTTEWNNQGYGRITTDSTIWSARGGAVIGDAEELAEIRIANGGEALYAGAYMSLLDFPDASILWCARPVGPVDSVEWSIVENFASNWRAGELPCWPTLRQTPAGYDAIATMRLDCDEDISSARDVFEWYMEEKIPFSLAIKSSLPMNLADQTMLRDVSQKGGAILSHSHNHKYGWGENYEDALDDAVTARNWFAKYFPDVGTPKNAVSPFHSNPVYAAQAVHDAGFSGMVSGIIHNDPEFLMGRAGQVPCIEGRLNSISQQAMLHGDCYNAQGNVQPYIDAFDLQYCAKGIYGWLDHPFSQRYQYGWKDKAQRLKAHKELVNALRCYGNVLFWNQNQCFDYLNLLDGISFRVNGDEVITETLKTNGDYAPVFVFQGEERTVY